MKITIDLEVKDLVELSKIKKSDLLKSDFLKFDNTCNKNYFNDLEKKLAMARENIFNNIENNLKTNK